jgi:hypothetical protein
LLERLAKGLPLFGELSAFSYRLSAFGFQLLVFG